MIKYNKKKLIDLIDSDRNSNVVISKQTGVSDNMIGRISRGESIPSLETLPLFAAYYGKDINYFFDLNEVIVKPNDSVKITDANEYMAKRIEDLAVENALLKRELEDYKSNFPKGYTLPNVQNSKAAEPTPKLKK